MWTASATGTQEKYGLSPPSPGPAPSSPTIAPLLPIPTLPQRYPSLSPALPLAHPHPYPILALVPTLFPALILREPLPACPPGAAAAG